VLLAFAALLGLMGCSDEGSLTELERLRATLMEPEDRDPYGLSVPRNDPRLQAIQRLVAIGTPDAVTVLSEFLTTYRANRHLKQHALSGLGMIGTEESLVALKGFREWAVRTLRSPSGFQWGFIDHSMETWEQHLLEPLVSTTDKSGTTWALFQWRRYGDATLWITSRAPSGKWSSPILTDVPYLPSVDWQSAELQVAADQDSFTLRIGDQAFPFSLRHQLLDSDLDGLTDIVEARLMTDLNTPDSDEDGNPDGTDPNPLTMNMVKADELAMIRQAVFTVMFSTTSSQDAIIMFGEGDTIHQEYSGYGGVVLRSPIVRRGFTHIDIDVKIDSPTTATATVLDWEGELASSTHVAELEKVYETWVIVRYYLRSIS
jgi:hypothetical protein